MIPKEDKVDTLDYCRDVTFGFGIPSKKRDRNIERIRKINEIKLKENKVVEITDKVKETKKQVQYDE